MCILGCHFTVYTVIHLDDQHQKSCYKNIIISSSYYIYIYDDLIKIQIKNPKTCKNDDGYNHGSLAQQCFSATQSEMS